MFKKRTNFWKFFCDKVLEKSIAKVFLPFPFMEKLLCLANEESEWKLSSYFFLFELFWKLFIQYENFVWKCRVSGSWPGRVTGQLGSSSLSNRFFIGFNKLPVIVKMRLKGLSSKVQSSKGGAADETKIEVELVNC